jgi:hypothetical protein
VVTKTALCSGANCLRHGLNRLQIHKHIRENQRICGAPSCTGGFGARFYLPNSLKSCSAVYRNWARLRISRSSLALPALENSPDFNRARTPAIACSWFVISARSCSLVNIVRTYEVRLPEGGAAVSAAYYVRVPDRPPHSMSSLNCEVCYVIDEIA